MGSEQDKQPRFADILEYHLNLKLQKYSKKDLTRDVMEEMYGMIRETVHKVFSKSSMNPTVYTKDWIAQKYYETIKLSGSKILTEDPASWEHSVSRVYEPVDISKLPLDELRFIGGLFNEMTFSDEILEEIRKR